MNISSATMKKSIITFSFFVFFTSLFAQDYYWVGGSGNWSDYDNHWATSSGGTTFHTQAPTSSDNVIFDVNSFDSFGQVVTLDEHANCLSMDWTGVTNFPVIDGNDHDMNIYGSLTLSADMTADFEDLEFESNTSGNTITTNGTDLGTSSNFRLNGTGGEWTLMDNLSCYRFFMIAGTLNTNDNNLDIDNNFITSGTIAKVLNLGSSQISASSWRMLGTNLTVNAGTSKISVSTFYSDELGDGPYDYYDVEFSSDGGSLRYSASFNTITIPAGTELSLRSGDTFTVNEIVAVGDKHNPIIISSLTDGVEATIASESANIDISFAELKDIHATGSATFTANNTIDNGNNDGWVINVPPGQDYYWVGDGGNWTDFANHWATESGGITFHSDYPGRIDNVFFDDQSFSMSDQTVTLDTDADCADMDWTGVTNAPRIYGAFGIRLNVFGSATFTGEVDKDVYTAEFEGSGTHSITYGETGDFVIMRLNGSGTYNFQDSVHVGLDIQFNNNGICNLNGNPVSTGRSFELVEGTLNAGSSSIYCDHFEFINSSSNPVFNAGTSTVTISESISINSSSNRSFTFHDLIFDGSVSIEGEHTLEDLVVKSGSSVSFEESTVTTINGELTLAGDKASPISISSTVNGVQATLSKASGTVNATYLILQDMNATGGSTFNATETIDNGNNTGWNITEQTGDDYYWVGGSGNWSDFENHWATSSGGEVFHTAGPGVLDNVYFDANSFDVASEIVTIDGSAANCFNFDASQADQFFWLSGSTKEINVYGSMDLSSNSNLDIGTFNFLATESATIDFAGGPGSTWVANFLSDGTWTFESDVVLRDLNMESGTINTGNYTFDIGQFFFLGEDDKTLNMGTSSFELNSWRSDLGANVTVNGGSSEVAIRGSYILGGDPSEIITLNNVTAFDDPIFYSDMDINQFTIEAGTTLKAVGSLSITMNELIAVGTEVSPIVIEPQTAGSGFTFIQATGTVNAEYLELEGVTATGGATFNAFNSIDNGDVVGWNFSRLPQTITFDPLEDKTYGDAPFLLEATASSGLDVSFQIISGPASLDDNELTITGVGTVQVRAEQSGDIDYEPAPSVLQTFDVEKASQTITFNALEAKTYGDDSFTLEATGGESSSPVTYESSNTDVATVDGNEVTIVGAGSTTITASQVGDENYLSAADVEQLLTVNKADQTITFDEIADYEIGVDTEPIMLAATSSSGLEITYAIDGPANLDGNELTPTGVGTVSITASQPGNSNYNAADDVEVSFEVTESTTLGISKVVLQIYPNPALSHFELRGLNGINIASIAIYSLNGELVKTYKEAHGPKKVGELSPGVYFVKVHQENKGFHTARLVVR